MQFLALTGPFPRFCLGDAVHRHPPMNGLGSNTCIQDAFNLAWKIAYVRKGIASPKLLESYSLERQPVGLEIISRANQGFRDHFHVWEALGMLHSDVTERRKILDDLSSATPTGRQRRIDLQQAINTTCHEFHGLGVEMGQHYASDAIYTADEPQPYQRKGQAAADPVLFYEPNSYPGSRLPHVWLNTAKPGKQISTIDLAGKGAFTLFTSIGGEAWVTAAKNVSARLQVPISTHKIGFRQGWEDVYFDWEQRRVVDESGAVLVRPDRFVAWRSARALPSADECEEKLGLVLRSILGY